MTAGWQRDDPKPIGFKTLREALQTIEEHERMKQRPTASADRAELGKIATAFEWKRSWNGRAAVRRYSPDRSRDAP
jgi:hypothetical protein